MRRACVYDELDAGSATAEESWHLANEVGTWDSVSLPQVSSTREDAPHGLVPCVRQSSAAVSCSEVGDAIAGAPFARALMPASKGGALWSS